MFTGYLNAGDLDGVISLYEPDARFVTRSGEVLVGREQVRRVVAALIDAKTVLESRVVKAVAAGDTAILYTDFCGRTVDAAEPMSKFVTGRSKCCTRSPVADGGS
jgi:uncharacterized protein (TIGR02246 family)